MARYDLDEVAGIVGRRIAEVRRAKGMTQANLAIALNVASQWVSAIERGQNVSVYTLARIANALDVPMSALVGLPKKPSVRSRSPRRTTRK